MFMAGRRFHRIPDIFHTIILSATCPNRVVFRYSLHFRTNALVLEVLQLKRPKYTCFGPLLWSEARSVALVPSFSRSESMGVIDLNPSESLRHCPRNAERRWTRPPPSRNLGRKKVRITPQERTRRNRISRIFQDM